MTINLVFPAPRVLKKTYAFAHKDDGGKRPTTNIVTCDVFCNVEMCIAADYSTASATYAPGSCNFGRARFSYTER